MFTEGALLSLLRRVPPMLPQMCVCADNFRVRSGAVDGLGRVVVYRFVARARASARAQQLAGFSCGNHCQKLMHSVHAYELCRKTVGDVLLNSGRAPPVHIPRD